MHLTIPILFMCFENHTIQSCCNCNPMCPQCSHALCSQFLLQQLLWHWTFFKEDMAYRNIRVTLDARSFCLTRRIQGITNKTHGKIAPSNTFAEFTLNLTTSVHYQQNSTLYMSRRDTTALQHLILIQLIDPKDKISTRQRRRLLICQFIL